MILQQNEFELTRRKSPAYNERAFCSSLTGPGEKAILATIECAVPWALLEE